MIDAAENAAESLSKKARDGIKEFCGLMKELKDSLLKKSASSDSPSKTDELAALASGEELRSLIQSVKIFQFLCAV